MKFSTTLGSLQFPSNPRVAWSPCCGWNPKLFPSRSGHRHSGVQKFTASADQRHRALGRGMPLFPSKVTANLFALRTAFSGWKWKRTACESLPFGGVPQRLFIAGGFIRPQRPEDEEAGWFLLRFDDHIGSARSSSHFDAPRRPLPRCECVGTPGSKRFPAPTQF